MTTVQASKPFKILLVEDNEHDRLAYRRALRGASWEVAEFEKPAEALTRILASPSDCDLLVVDYKLPGMTGLELCRRLQDQKVDLPMILITGAGSEDLAVEALKTGVSDYLVKSSGPGYWELLPITFQRTIQDHRDKQARRRAEEALKEAERQYRDLYENAPVGYYTAGPDRVIVNINRSLLNLVGYTRGEIVGKKTLKDLIPARYFPIDAVRYGKILCGEVDRFVGMEFSMVHKDGREIPVRMDASVVRDEKGSILRTRMVVTDISELMKTLTSLKTQIRNDATLADCAKVLLEKEGDQDPLQVSLSHLLKAVCASRAYIYEQVDDPHFGPSLKKKQEVCVEGIPPRISCIPLATMSPTPSDLFSDPHIILGIPENFPDPFRDVCREFQIRSFLMIPIRVSDTWFGFIGFDQCVGPWKGEEYDIRMLETASDMIGNYISLRRTEMELKQAKEKAENATRIKDKFISMVSHDLRSPFNAIMGSLSLLEQEVRDRLDPSELEPIGRVQRSCRQMVKMIDQLLDLSRLHSGKVKLKREFLDAHAVASMACGNLSTLATQKGIEVVNEVPPGTRLYADFELYLQVLQNLLSNAIKFCNRGDRISFFLSQGREATVAVRDTGVGIDKNLLQDLFNPDVKTTTPGTEGERGTGLGLPLCREIMELHGGDLTVDSEKGIGSVFSVTLPAVKPLILIVDDNAQDRNLLAALVKKIGVETLEAGSGMEALRLLESTSPHLILLDLSMPQMDGFQLLETIRKGPRTVCVPVIALTVDSGPRSRERALLLGASDFTAKPVADYDLIPRIRKFVG